MVGKQSNHTSGPLSSHDRPARDTTHKERRPKGRHGEGTISKLAEDRYRYRLRVKGQDRTAYANTRDGINAEKRRIQAEVYGERPDTRPLGDRTTTLDALLDRWLEHARPLLPRSTYDNTVSSFRNHVRPTLGRRRLADLTPRDIVLLRDALLKRYKPNTVRFTLARLRTALSWAVERRELASDPSAGVPIHLGRPQAVTVFSEPEIAILLRSTRDDYWGPLWLLLVDSGMRIGEALGARQEDLDRATGVLRVSRTRHRGEDGPIKSRAGYREIQLTAATVAALARYPRRPHGPLVPKPDGSHVSPQSVAARFYTALERAGIPRRNRTLHTLRHSCATHQLAHRVPVHAVSDQLGHADIKTTLAIYGHLIPKMLDAGLAAREAILGAVVEVPPDRPNIVPNGRLRPRRQVQKR